MNALLEKYIDYMRLAGCKAVYELVNGITLELEYREENFAHLLGLHKLRDLWLIQSWLDQTNRTVKLADVIKRIKTSRFTDEMIRNSVFFYTIEKRYESFSYDNLTTLSYTDAIIDFDASLIRSKLKSDYILFELKNGSEYNHMGIAQDPKRGYRYIETFFHEMSDKYVAGQTCVRIKSYRLYDIEGRIIVEDSFTE